MTDEQKALLGDHEAAKRLTDKGLLLSMTKEEAIATLEESKRQNKIMIDNPTTFWASHQMADGVKNAKRRIEALDHALSALRPVSREQAEKVWRGEWITPTIIGGRAYNIPHCSACNGVPCGTDEHTRFCAHCGAPMTGEAVDMVMERLEALKDE